MNIEELDLSVRSYNCLKRSGIDTVEKLNQRSDSDLLRIRGMNQKCVEEIRIRQAMRPVTGRDVLNTMSNAEMAGVFSSGCDRCIVRGCTIREHGSQGCGLSFQEWLDQPVGR